MLLLVVLLLTTSASSMKPSPPIVSELYFGKLHDHAAYSELPPDAIARVRAYFEDHLDARYMEKNCEPATYPGWDTRFPLIQCGYSVKGKKDNSTKTARVIMLNPSPDQLAHWAVFTCIDVTGAAAKKCTGKLSRHIIGQSGAQFPLAGIVFEDILPADGKFEVFAFRNGVTVRVKGVNHLGTSQPTDDEINQSINGVVLSSGKYARIQSTTRQQYLANGGTREVAGLAWLDVSRDLYQGAWGKDRNELMIAWAKANVSLLK